MRRVFSNGGKFDYVRNPFERLAGKALGLHLAAPYFTASGPVVEAASAGKTVQLLVGLNSATHPDALAAVLESPNVAVRFLTHRFHAKIYIFDDCVILGSANLTDGGLSSNREAAICLDQPEDFQAIEEVRALFLELWEQAKVMTPAIQEAFARAWRTGQPRGPGPDELIEEAVGRAEPRSITVGSEARSKERLFLDGLQRQIYEQYRPAFSEVSNVLSENGFRRPELEVIGLANETNRFLNWVRLSYVIGDEAWRAAPQLSPAQRRERLLHLGAEWANTTNNMVPATYVGWLRTVDQTFGSHAALGAASKEQITQGLLSLHAFTEQLRFVKGGLAALPAAFWAANNDDVERVRRTLAHLIHGPGDLVPRLHDVLYDSRMKLGNFGFFSALELFGTVKPEVSPPMNGRMAKALRYLGYDVKAA
jgi:hypothetical protein